MCRITETLSSTEDSDVWGTGQAGVSAFARDSAHHRCGQGGASEEWDHWHTDSVYSVPSMIPVAVKIVDVLDET